MERIPRPPRLSSIGVPKVGVFVPPEVINPDRVTGTIIAFCRKLVSDCGARKPSKSCVPSWDAVMPSMEKPFRFSGITPTADEAVKPK